MPTAKTSSAKGKSSKKPAAAKPKNTPAAAAGNGSAGTSTSVSTPAPKKKKDVEMIELEEDYNGNRYLDGQRPLVPRVLFEAVHSYQANKDKKAALDKTIKSNKDKVAGLSREYREFFEANDDGTKFTYDCGGVIVKVNHKETETVEISKETATTKNVTKRDGKKKGGDTPADIY